MTATLSGRIPGGSSPARTCLPSLPETAIWAPAQAVMVTNATTAANAKPLFITTSADPPALNRHLALAVFATDNRCRLWRLEDHRSILNLFHHVIRAVLIGGSGIEEH